jgi:hypothetical protein
MVEAPRISENPILNFWKTYPLFRIGISEDVQSSDTFLF